MRTFVEIIIILLLGAAFYYFISSKKVKISSYENQIQELQTNIDSLSSEVASSNSRITEYRDSIQVLDSLYTREQSDIDSIKTVYVKEKIPRIDNFTADSLVRYFRTRYRKSE